MKRKVKKYAGGMLTDSSGNPVRSSSGQPVRTRSADEIAEDNKRPFGRYATSSSPKKSAPSEDLAPYEAPSTWSGDQSPKSTTSKDIKEEPATGPASGFNAQQYLEDSGPKGGGSGRTSTISPAKKKKPKPRYSDVVSSKDLGSQSFSSAAKSPASGSDVSAPGGKMIDRNSRDFAGVKSASGNSYLSPPKYGANKISDEEAAQIEKKRSVANAKKMAATAAENKSKSATSLKSPGSKMDMNDPYSMSLGSEFDPKGMMRRNSRLTGDMDYKRGGAVKKMASGGKVSSASSRGDGIAQRGKTKGRMC
jgi:hypothetical protein